ncbi:MAG: AAA family ATPase [Methylococcaceae bacterium]
MAGALAWSEEINKHNQRLFMQEQTKTKTSNVKPINGVNVVAEKLPFPLKSASTMTDELKPPVWLLKGFIEQGTLNLLFGEPGTFKSLFVLDWAFCMAAGLSWCGLRTKQTDVVILCGEGFSGQQRRLRALEIKYGMKAPAGLFISEIPAQMLDAKNVEWIAESIKENCPNVQLIAIDTLHRNMSGDENSSQDIGTFINNIDMYFKPLGAATLVCHHSGHGQKDRSRGSSSIRGSMDGEFSTTKSGGGVALACHKSKDFESLNSMQFKLQVTELDGWLDEDDEPLTSVYLEHQGVVISSDNKSKLTPREEVILTSLKQVLAHDDSNDFATIESWRDEVMQAIDGEADAKRMAFNRCKEKLLKQDVIVERDGLIWLCD